MGRTLFYHILHHYTRPNTISTFSSLAAIPSPVNAHSSTALSRMFWMSGGKDYIPHYAIIGSIKAWNLSPNPVKGQTEKVDWQTAAYASITYYVIRGYM
jgi:hypothetical protein